MGGERIEEEEEEGGGEQTESVQKHYIIPDLIRAFLSPTTTATPHSVTLSSFPTYPVCF